MRSSRPEAESAGELVTGHKAGGPLSTERLNNDEPVRGRLPKHLQVSEMLVREINAGILLEGERLEPERAMAARLGIAVGTLRKALADLEQKGLLERLQGSGNYVRNVDGVTAKTIYGFFRLELLAGGGLPSATTLEVNKVKADESVCFSQNSGYYRIRRARRLSDVDAALEEIWLDASHVGKEIRISDLHESLYQFYKKDLGFWIARVEDSISCNPPPSWQPSDFAVNSNAVWGYVERKGWNQHGIQVEYSRTWFDTNTARYVSRIK